MDVTAVLEEIALEGLDGITLNSLWVRLKNRPGFHFESIDEHVKKYVWKHLCQSREIEFFQLENPRPELVIIDYDSLVQENRCYFADEFPPDIYSFKIVDKNGIYGCCDNFDTRVPVTRDIQSEDGTALITVEQAVERWGQKLTIVASQKLRFQALLHTNYLPTGITAEAYAILERVGRSRYIGEPAKVQDRPGLVNELMSSSNLFAIIKLLCSRGYLVKQPFNVYLETKGRYCHSRLVHLRHFYRKSMANTSAYLNSVCVFLQGKPGMMATSETVMQTFGMRLKDISRHSGPSKFPLAIASVPYRSVFPDATTEEYNDRKGQEKMLKILKLTRPYKGEDVNDINEEEDTDGEEKDEAEGFSDDSHEKGSCEAIAGQYLYDLSLPSAITHMIKQSGSCGISEIQIRQRLHAPVKFIEQAMRGLLKANVIFKFTQQIGTHRLYKYMIREADQDFKQIQLETEDQNGADNLNASRDSNPSQECLQEADVDFKDEDEEDTASIDEMIRSLNVSWVIEKTDSPIPPDEMTMKRQERRDYILRRLANQRVYRKDNLLLNEMVEWEKKRGWKEKMCRKSFRRIVKRLHEEGKISYVKVTCNSSFERKRDQFLGDINLKEDDMALKKAAVQQYTYRIKYQTAKEKQSSQEKDEKDPEVFLQPVSIYAIFQKAAGDYRLRNTNASRRVRQKQVNLFHLPGKAEKAQMLHEFMFYLLYDYKGDPKAAENLKTDEERKEPPVYLDVKDWRRYLPPLKLHNIHLVPGMIPGSCMIGDILVTMPICIFCKLISIDHEVESLKSIMEDNDKKLYPLVWLPGEILNQVLYSRFFLQKLNNIMRLLCHLGLLSYGPKLPIWHIEYVIVYLHQKATVLNTTTSLPSYNETRCPEGQEFSKIHFHFDTLEKVQKFWHEIHLICIGSNLGGRDFKPEITEKPVKSQQLLKENLLDVIRPREFIEIQEDDWLPGDHRGACGFDSSLFMHYVRFWKSRTPKEPRKPKRTFVAPRKASSTVTRTHSEGHTQRKIKRVQFEKPKKARKLLKMEAKKLMRKRRISTGTGGPKKKCARLRTVLDDEDKQAKREMDRLRARFSPLENGIILISHVAYQIMNPGGLALSMPIRDIRMSIREFLPNVFKDKTQHAMRLRFRRYASDKNFMQHIAFYLTKARYDQELMSNYRDSWGDLSHPEIFAKYIELIKHLFHKFSSPDSPLLFPWPSTMAELHSKYDQVDTLKICQRETRRVNFNCENLYDIQSLSLWNLLLGWIYNPTQVSNREMYLRFCQYPVSVICNARDLLKNGGVMIVNKRNVDENNAIPKSAGVIHNMVLTSRHKKAMESRYPEDVYENTLKQIEDFEDAFWLKKSAVPHISDAQNGQTVSCDTFQPEPQQSSQDDRPAGQISTQCQKQDIEDSQEEEVYRELDWKRYQGGCSMAVLSLLAMDMVKVKIFIPDEMIHVSEDAKKNLSFKKGKRPAEDMEETANDSNDEDLRPPLKGMRKSINLHHRSESSEKQTETLPSSSLPSPLDNTEEGTSRSGQQTLKQVKEGTTVIAFNPTNAAAAGTLANHAVSLASGTLLTLAKTSVIERLDVANSNYKSKRVFIVEPLKMEFALKGEAQVEATGNESKRNENDCMMDCEQEPRDCPTELSIDSVKKESAQTDVYTEQSLHSKVESPLCIQSKQLGKSTAKSSCFTRTPKADFSQLFSRLEQVFPEDYEQTDVRQEMRSRLPSSFVEKGEELYQLIDSYGFPGITELEIEQSQGVPFSSLTSLIKCLCDMSAILKVGCEERRFIGRRHLQKWTVLIQPRTSGEDGSAQSDSSAPKYRILAQPWRSLNGDLNVVFLKHSLHTLLTFLYQHPGLHVEEIANRFHPHLLPSAVYDLLDLLEELGCIEMTYIAKSPKPTIFGPSTCSEPGFLSSSHRVVDITMVSPIQLALFMRALKQHCQAKKLTVG